MPRPEDYHPAHQEAAVNAEPLAAFALPSALKDYLGELDRAFLPHQSDQGTVLVLKLPGDEIAGMSGRVPLVVSHELRQHPAAPVIRTVIKIYDHPKSSLALETFTNVDDDQQWADFASLAEQETFTLLFYDETLRYRLSKQVPNAAGDSMSRILTYADRIRAAIPDEQYDFDRAKATVLASTRL